MKKLMLSVVCLFMWSACGGSKAQTVAKFNSLEEDESYIYSAPAQLRFMSVKNQKGIYRICSEPNPDVAANSSSKFNSQLALSLQTMMKMSQQLQIENKKLKQQLYASELQRKAMKDAIQRDNKSNRNSSYSTDVQNSLNTQNALENSAGGSGSIGVAFERALTIVELKGRSEDVLLARDFLYRICEAAQNDPSKYTARDVINMQAKALMFLQKTRSIAAQAKITTANATILTKLAEFKAARDKQCNNAYNNAVKGPKQTQEKCLQAAKKFAKTKKNSGQPGTTQKPKTKAECDADYTAAIGPATKTQTACLAASQKTHDSTLAAFTPSKANDRSELISNLYKDGTNRCEETYAIDLKAAGKDEKKKTKAKTDQLECLNKIQKSVSEMLKSKKP